jgi:hypothetical protein
MHSIMQPCALCSTALMLVDRQPVLGQHEVMFFKCDSCGTTAQWIVNGEPVDSHGCQTAAIHPFASKVTTP